MTANHLILFSSWPDLIAAQQAAKLLVEQHLAACVKLLPQAQSFYIWEEQLEESTEVILIIKTTRQQYTALQAALVKIHPYQVPELIGYSASHGLPAYLAWIEKSTQ
ncbi:divalent-cation tolerance protein CutA [Thiofilum flexile]|uniref:divalent-cation tolerance protein CutA n=1 Tax=Thiofilum flexile TaxID=125627 RepID=UPI0003730974|nr:divalent-cation tolerance protein CutA [Thiofilum flexile]